MTISIYKQKQIVKKRLMGLSERQIAKALKTSRKTVRKYSDKHGVVPRYQKASSPIGYLKDGRFQSRLDPVRIPPYPYRDPYRDEYELPGYADDDGYPATDTYKTQNNNPRVRNESMDISETKTILPTSKPIEEKLVTFDKRLCSLETQQKNNSITSEQLRNSNQQKQALQEKYDTLAQKIYYDQGLRDQNDHMMKEFRELTMETKNIQKETNQPKEMIPDFIRTERGRSGKENSETSPRKLDVTVLNKKMPIEQVEKGVNHSGLESDQRFQIPDWMIGGVVCFSLIAIKFLLSCDSSFQYHPQVPVQRMIVSSKKNEKQSM